MPEPSLNFDAFSSGQIGSKLWLCQELEKIRFAQPQSIWILGGWYGVLAFLLLSRERIPIAKIRSFDLDESANRLADILNENWVWRDWKFKAVTKDANSLVYGEGESSPPPDIVINTSTEHFESREWFERIPKGVIVALQSNDMDHEDHVANVRTTAELEARFPLTDRLYSGERPFVYPTWRFRRFMTIGRK